MDSITYQWFRQQVKTLPGVRNCIPERSSDADFVIRTWVGMNVNVYFLNGTPNVRSLKRVIQENTRTYRASIFIALHNLMPPDHKRLIPDEWMHALHELNSERVYTFNPGEECLHQVHFDHLPDGIQREAWHGDEVTFEKLRVLNVTAKLRVIRGQWMMADFGPNPYWMKSEHRAERLKQRYHGSRQRRVYGAAWGHYDMGGHPGGATDEALQQAHELERCHRLLGIVPTATKDEVKAAFRKLAREFHPDVSQLTKDEAEARFREINRAYETIKTRRGWS